VTLSSCEHDPLPVAVESLTGRFETRALLKGELQWAVLPGREKLSHEVPARFEEVAQGDRLETSVLRGDVRAARFLSPPATRRTLARLSSAA
jgi:hypothetical protein